MSELTDMINALRWIVAKCAEHYEGDGGPLWDIAAKAEAALLRSTPSEAVPVVKSFERWPKTSAGAGPSCRDLDCADGMIPSMPDGEPVPCPVCNVGRKP